MTKSPSQRASDPARGGAAAAVSDAVPRYRSGAVARMARIPVATLRTWERRFQVSASVATRGGHRFYSAADVQRLALLKQLADLGHSIGAMATLDIDRLRKMAVTHASTLADAQRGARGALPTAASPWRIVVVGAAVGRRLQRPAFVRELGHTLELVGPFDGLPACLAAGEDMESEARMTSLGSSKARSMGASKGSSKAGSKADSKANSKVNSQGTANARSHERSKAVSQARVDLLLVHAATLQESQLKFLRKVIQAWKPRQVALLYSYGARDVCEDAVKAGMVLQREPLTDTALANWLRSLGERLIKTPVVTDEPADLPGSANSFDPTLLMDSRIGPRRYDDATLADIAGLSSTIACECPRHVADLLLQLSHFEVYSAECASRSRADADLHAYLQQAAGASRSLFEAALERVALHEGLLLPG